MLFFLHFQCTREKKRKILSHVLLWFLWLWFLSFYGKAEKYSNKEWGSGKNKRLCESRETPALSLSPPHWPWAVSLVCWRLSLGLVEKRTNTSARSQECMCVPFVHVSVCRATALLPLQRGTGTGSTLIRKALVTDPSNKDMDEYTLKSYSAYTAAKNPSCHGLCRWLEKYIFFYLSFTHYPFLFFPTLTSPSYGFLPPSVPDTLSPSPFVLSLLLCLLRLVQICLYTFPKSKQTGSCHLKGYAANRSPTG